MASGTVYGNQVSKWRCYGDWWTNETDTQVTIYCRPGMQSMAWGFQISSSITATANIGGSAASASGDFYSSTGATVSTAYLTHSRTYNKGTSAFNVDVYAKIENVSGYQSGTSTAYVSVPVASLASYAVSFNANGGSGAPGSQTKWYGTDISLSNTRPSWTGHTFLGWATSASGSIVYQPGEAYSKNASVTLYAKWSTNTYTVSFNANGGSGAPGSQTKTYGDDLTLSPTKPTRTNYNFLGWAATSSATSAQYSAGGQYTTNASVTLYAVWSLAYTPPRITDYNIARCNSSGTITDDGTYAKVTFNWATDKTLSSIKITTTNVSVTPSGSGTSGSVSQIIGGSLSTESQYTVTITVTDANGSSTITMTLAPLAYIFDFAPDGSVGVGVVASQDEFGTRANFGIPTTFSKEIKGISGWGHYGDTWQWKLLARSKYEYNSLSSRGVIHLIGDMGTWDTHWPIDISIPTRWDVADNLSGIKINCDPYGAQEKTRIIVTIDSSNKVNVWIAVLSYASFNIIISGFDIDIVDSSFIVSPSTPSGHVLKFNTGVRNEAYNRIEGINGHWTYNNGYWGLTNPSWDNSDWIRSTVNGFIPYQSGGASSLGTSAWPFNNIYSVKASVSSQLDTKTFTVDSLHANTSYNSDRKFKFYWGSGVTSPCGFGGDVCTEIWNGTLSAGGTATVTNLYKYNIFIIYLKDVTTPLFCFRQYTNVNESDIAGGGISPYTNTYNEIYQANNAGSCLLRATSYNTLVSKNSYVIQQNQNGNWIESRPVIRIIGVI